MGWFGRRKTTLRPDERLIRLAVEPGPFPVHFVRRDDGVKQLAAFGFLLVAVLCPVLVGMHDVEPGDFPLWFLVLFWLGYGLALWCFLFWPYRTSITLTETGVQERRRRLLCTSRYDRPYSDYLGLGMRMVDTGRFRLVYEIALLHPKKRFNVPLWRGEQWQPPRYDLERYARWLGVPVVDLSVDGYRPVDAAEFDHRLPDRLQKGLCPVDDTWSVEPAPGRVDVEADQRQVAVVTHPARPFMFGPVIALLAGLVALGVAACHGFGWFVGGEDLVAAAVALGPALLYIGVALYARQPPSFDPEQFVVDTSGVHMLQKARHGGSDVLLTVAFESIRYVFPTDSGLVLVTTTRDYSIGAGMGPEVVRWLEQLVYHRARPTVA